MNSTSKQSLKASVINSSLWTMGGYAAAQLLRLISNVVMAKLLFPEAFGLMTLVMIFMQGISMFSDIGITPSIIQNKRGNEPKFLNTAWTMQVIRGFILWGITLIGAYPYSIAYNEPLLLWMLPVAGLTAVIAGFNSTSLATSNRSLQLKKVTIVELTAQVASLVVMIGWVYFYPNVWGLVAGNLVNSLVKLALSHYWIAEDKNYFHWEKEAASSLFRFGRWIFVSTALTFFAAQIDRILLGYLMGTATLGIYSIAAMFRETTLKATQMLGEKVLFPSYAKIINNGDNERLYAALKKTRLIIVVSTWVAAIILMFFGSKVIDWLYDDRYKDAIWMIQIMPLGTLVGVLSLTYQNVYLAKGKSSYITLLLSFQLAMQLIAILVGNFINGLHGVVFAITCIGWLIYPANILTARKLKIWQPEIDFPVILLAVAYTIAYLRYISII